jgi:hypothetical protein
MSATETFTASQTFGQEYWVPCEKCSQDSQDTKHRVQASFSSKDTSPDGDIHVGADFEIVQCVGCQWISFRQSWWSSEDLDEDGSPLRSVDLFPARLKGRKPLEHVYYLAGRVKAIYDEMHFALRNGQHILAAIGFRALVEAVADEKGANGGDLKKRIDDLVAKGVLTKAGASILHGIRLLGNRAAHEVAAPSEQQLIAGLIVVENLLSNVFILPEIARRLPKDKKK